MNGIERDPSHRTVILDLTHLGRHVTGIERVSIDQFEKQIFAGAKVETVRSRGLLSMIFKQHVLLPLRALLNRKAVFVFPGFPPSPLFSFARNRTLLYVHDLFLMTRSADLSLKARLYMAPSFRTAVRSLRYYLVNSQKTRDELAPHVSDDAVIELYRPGVGNPFRLSGRERASRPDRPYPLKLVMVGTVEPRKNYPAALAILKSLRSATFPDAELHVIGRPGWGVDSTMLATQSGIHVHGYLPVNDAKAVIESADIYLCTSHDEGLGLPLIEAQFAGLPVVAPDAPIFREVLGNSGTFIPPGDPEASARIITELTSAPGWRAAFAAEAENNVARWNALARADLDRALQRFSDDLSHTMPAIAQRTT